MTWDVIIIGGGAAGLWAAGTAAARNLRTLVLEKNNKPGVKILMSGGNALQHYAPLRREWHHPGVWKPRSIS